MAAYVQLSFVTPYPVDDLCVNDGVWGSKQAQILAPSATETVISPNMYRLGALYGINDSADLFPALLDFTTSLPSSSKCLAESYCSSGPSALYSCSARHQAAFSATERRIRTRYTYPVAVAHPTLSALSAAQPGMTVYQTGFVETWHPKTSFGRHVQSKIGQKADVKRYVRQRFKTPLLSKYSLD